MVVPYFLPQSFVDPKASGENRITSLSHLRNLALKLLLEESRSRNSRFPSRTTVIFVNDIVLWLEDILESLHEHILQSATIICAFDWNPAGASCYDSWVLRSLLGNLLFEVTYDGKHWRADKTFFDRPDSVVR